MGLKKCRLIKSTINKIGYLCIIGGKIIFIADNKNSDFNH